MLRYVKWISFPRNKRHLNSVALWMTVSGCMLWLAGRGFFSASFEVSVSQGFRPSHSEAPQSPHPQAQNGLTQWPKLCTEMLTFDFLTSILSSKSSPKGRFREWELQVKKKHLKMCLIHFAGCIVSSQSFLLWDALETKAKETAESWREFSVRQALCFFHIGGLSVWNSSWLQRNRITSQYSLKFLKMYLSLFVLQQEANQPNL